MQARRDVFLVVLAFALTTLGAARCFAEGQPTAAAPASTQDAADNSPPAAEPSDGNESVYPVTGPETARRAQQELLPVGEWGDPAKLLFEGVETFPVEEVRKALQADLKYQAASRPSNISWYFRRVLAQRVQQGYRSNGFAEVRVDVRRGEAKAPYVVQVVEGPRYRQGNVLVRGTDRIDAAALREWLAHLPATPGWQITCGQYPLPPLDDQLAPFRAGEAVDYTEAARLQLQSAVRWALIEQGFAGAQVWPKWIPSKEPGVADLVVDVIDAGQEATVDAIEVRGLRRDSREELLKYLGVSMKGRVDGKLLRRIDERLADSCRYWSHQLAMGINTPPIPINEDAKTNVKLVLDLEEFTSAPPLGRPLAEADEILRKAARWINKLREDNAKFAVVCEGKIVDANDPNLTMEFHPLAIGSDGRVAADIKYNSTIWAADHAVLISSQSVELVDWARREKFSVACPISPTIEIRLQPEKKENGEYGQRLFVGYCLTQLNAESRKRPSLDIQVAPVALVYLAHRTGAKVAIQDGKLTTSSEGVEIQFDAATGAVLQVRCDADLDSGNNLTMTFDSGDLAAAATEIHTRANEFPDRFDPGHPVTSWLTFILDQAQSQPGVAGSPKLSVRLAAVRNWLQHPIVAAPLNRMDEWIVAKNLTAQSGDPALGFSIPSTLPVRTDDSEELRDSAAQLAVVSADQLFPRGSWPWTLMREYSFGRFADGTADASSEDNDAFSEREYERVMSGDGLGPVSALSILSLGRSSMPTDAEKQARDRRLRPKFVECGLRNLSDEAFLRDIRIFTSDETQFGMLCCISAEKYCSLSDSQQAQLRDALPKPCRPLLTALGTRRGANPEEPIVTSIEHVLLDEWHNTLRDKVDTQLRAHAAEVAQKPEVVK